ncbi:DUF6316 family protein [Thiohalophilus thiocyanatoxydans]|uniref:DUF6316 domain-containing protein n=1 Tax=Thiohalophilus thiocyanatoxydans TaxID=381308 RepID=A0A4R8IFL0_9GAMM|nr:hypothetical protein EDC23_2522 [Thiohalophilus thiocyanatoxydans]
MFQLHNRHGEEGAVLYRSSRFYTIDSEWWFAIRRGPDQGPYPSRASARQALIEFLNNQFESERQLQQDRESHAGRPGSVHRFL